MAFGGKDAARKAVMNEARRQGAEEFKKRAIKRLEELSSDLEHDGREEDAELEDGIALARFSIRQLPLTPEPAEKDQTE